MIIGPEPFALVAVSFFCSCCCLSMSEMLSAFRNSYGTRCFSSALGLGINLPNPELRISVDMLAGFASL